jgi:hypothetical protein
VYVQLGGNLESAGPVWRVYCSLYWQWVQMSRRTSASRRPRIHLNGAQPSLKNRSSQLTIVVAGQEHEELVKFARGVSEHKLNRRLPCGVAVFHATMAQKRRSQELAHIIF